MVKVKKLRALYHLHSSGGTLLSEIIRPLFRTLLSIPVTYYSLELLQSTFSQ